MPENVISDSKGGVYMGLNDTPLAGRVHIGIFGNRNAGKSSLINAITGQNLAIVSEVLGTTTDPVYKSMELLPLGPVVFIDTPGIDDVGILGEERVKKSLQVLRKTEYGILVMDGSSLMKEQSGDLTEEQNVILGKMIERKLPFAIVINKAEMLKKNEIERIKGYSWTKENKVFFVSTKTGEGIQELKEGIATTLKDEEMEKVLIRDLLSPEDIVVLVTPIDEAAPKGRIILPQQQTIRDILDGNAICVVTKETQLEKTLDSLSKQPRLVVTDSQAFSVVDKIVPKSVELTSFSILFARMKGNLEWQVNGARTIDKLKSRDKILIAEGCTHHRQCGDIGTEKLPKLLKKYTGKQLDIQFCSGTQFPEEIESYKMIIHCGGCMLNESEMKYRINHANSNRVSITNYGVAIAFMNGILDRSLESFDKK